MKHETYHEEPPGHEKVIVHEQCALVPGWFAVYAADPQFLSGHPHFLQVAEDVLGHAFGQIDEAVIVTDVHLPDVTPFEARLVGNCPNDVAGFHPVSVTDFEAEGFKHNIVG